MIGKIFFYSRYEKKFTNYLSNLNSSYQINSFLKIGKQIILLENGTSSTMF